nr:HAD family phosphatase [uncultured Anaerobutyricum sp.]
MLKLVIFDMDGLMFATEQVNYRAFTEIVKEEGYEPTFEQFTGFLGMNARDIQKKYYSYYGENVDAEGIYKKVGQRAKQIIRKEGVPEKAGLRQLLKVVKEKELLAAVASGSDTEVIKEYLERTGLTPYFDTVLSSKEVKRGKPYPDIFLEICKQLNIKTEETLVLEDSANGVQAALAGNFSVINIPDLLPIPEEQQEKCVAVVEDLNKVINYIK